MSTLPPNPPDPGQAQAAHPVTEQKTDQLARQKYEGNWLRGLSGLPDTAVIYQNCCCSYTFYYSREIDFLRFLRDPDAVRQQIMAEVTAQLNGTLHTMEEAVLEWIKRREQGNQSVTTSGT